MVVDHNDFHARHGAYVGPSVRKFFRRGPKRAIYRGHRTGRRPSRPRWSLLEPAKSPGFIRAREAGTSMRLRDGLMLGSVGAVLTLTSGVARSAETGVRMWRPCSAISTTRT